MTGRNPSYCFVDFVSKDVAERVMVEYNGREFMRRPLKVKPGVKSGTGRGRFDMQQSSESKLVPPRSLSAKQLFYRFERLRSVSSTR